MQLNIGIVEDEPHFTGELLKHIDRWQADNYCAVKVQDFGSCQDFLSCRGRKFDVIFLDIQLPDGTGVELAKTLRKSQYKGEIVFLTAFQEYVFEGYQVRALNYLLKPTGYEPVRECLDTVFLALNDENYIYRYRDEIIKIPYHEILYLTSANHRIVIFSRKRTYLQTDLLRNVIKYLPQQFAQCHRTTVVNMHHVIQIRSKELVLSDKSVLPVSESYLGRVRSTFVAQAQKGGPL